MNPGRPRLVSIAALLAAAVLLSAGLEQVRPPLGMTVSHPRLVAQSHQQPSRSHLLVIARRYLAHHVCPGIHTPSALARRMAHDLRLHLTTLPVAAPTACNPTRAAH